MQYEFYVGIHANAEFLSFLTNTLLGVCNFFEKDVLAVQGIHDE